MQLWLLCLHTPTAVMLPDLSVIVLLGVHCSADCLSVTQRHVTAAGDAMGKLMLIHGSSNSF